MKSKKQTVKVITDDTERRRVNFFQRSNGTFGFEELQFSVKQNFWFSSKNESDQTFVSYAESLVAAFRNIDWISFALEQEGDWRYTYHLELLRGQSFRFCAYQEEQFGNDHHHCSACWQKIAERDWPEVVHQGYVTRYAIPDGSGKWQWNWVCENCYSDLRELLNWQLEP